MAVPATAKPMLTNLDAMNFKLLHFPTGLRSGGAASICGAAASSK
jgi:hypothetical protein